MIIEGDPADDRDNIVIAPAGGTAVVEANCDHCHLRHLKLAGTPASYAVIFHSGNVQSEISDCNIAAGKYLYLYYGCFVHDSAIVGSGSYALRIGSGRVRRCYLSAPGGTAIQATGGVVVEGCVFDDFSTGVYQYSPRLVMRVLNCTFYNGTYGMLLREGLGSVPVSINNIFKDVDYPYRGPVWPEETATNYGPIFLLRHNCFDGYIAFAYGPAAATKTYAEFTALNGVDASGDLDSTDPKLTDPGSGDFSLAADSPCRHAGQGSGVVSDLDGTPYDEHHPDIGSRSSGPLSVVAPSIIAAVDDESGTSFTLTIDADNAADVISARYESVGEDEWNLFGSTRTGDGDLQITGVTVGYFAVIVTAARGGLESLPSDPVFVWVSSSAPSGPHAGVRALLDQALGVFEPTNVAFPNAEYAPTGGTLYLRPTFLPAMTEQAELGDEGENKLLGLYQIDVYGSTGVGVGETEIVAEGLLTAFKRGKTFASSVVTARIEKAWRGPAAQEADRYRVPVFIEWFAYVAN